MKIRRGLVAALAVLVALVVASSAQAAHAPLYPGGTVPCTTLSSNGNIRQCSGFTQTWDGTKIDVNVFLPPETGGTEGPYPTIGDFHGWGSAKQGLNEVPPKSPSTPGGFLEGKDVRIQHWAEEGYAVFSMSDRGWGLSCGKFDPVRELEEAEAKKGTPKPSVCATGYNHLMDDRYEVRDAQFLLGELADEGVVEPKKIGATGVSYGGGMSTALAALKNRTMLEHGELVPWTSPVKGLEMELAAAAPQWPWTDIAYALAPNGRNLDYVTDSTYRGPQGKFPVGVWKASFSEYLYQAGLLLSNYNEKDPEANIPGWILRLKGGEPYTDSTVNGIIQELSTFHSSFGINSSVEPSPLLIQSGWNDDLFPVDEALRLYQRTRAQYPGDPISLFLADIGHARSQNKPADAAAFNARLDAWFAHYLKGEGAAPSSSVEALTTTCPETTPSEGPFKASDWSGLAPGEIRFGSAAAQTIAPRAGEEAPTTASGAFDPVVGPGVCQAIPEAAAEEAGNADYRLAPAPAGGFTLMGSPTIVADVQAQSPNSEIAARLVDVSPAGSETLVARTLYRPTGGSQEVVFQLHPQGYHFAAGHVAKLELLPVDYPYGRFSNLQAPIIVSDLEMRLPVIEQPGALGGLVQTPAPKVVPAGYTLAAEYQAGQNGGGSGGTSGGNTTPTKPAPAPVVKIGSGALSGKLSATRSTLVIPLDCRGEGACTGSVTVTAKTPGKKGRTTLTKSTYSLASQASTSVRLPLTKSGRKLVKSLLGATNPPKTLGSLLELTDSGKSTSQKSQRAVQLPRGN
jgi:X-Pro dipeptidyl-peptidase (S15 family)